MSGDIGYSPMEMQTILAAGLRVLTMMRQGLDAIRLTQMGVSLDDMERKLEASLRAVNETLNEGDDCRWVIRLTRRDEIRVGLRDEEAEDGG